MVSWMCLLLGQTALEILTHAHHARVITRWAVNLRSLRAALKFIETTGSTFAGFLASPVTVSDVSTLKRLLARVYAW